jgi:signal transduction histidine kinase
VVAVTRTSPNSPAAPGSPVGPADRLLAGGLIWLLVLTWVSAVVVAGLYAGGMTATRVTVPAWVVGVSATVAVVTSVPVLRWLRPRVEALLFTHPDDAADLIAELGRRVAGGVATQAGVPTVATEVADQVARRLRLPYAAIVPAGAEAPAGAPAVERLVRVPLDFAGEPVGVLFVLPRRGARSLAAEDHALLGELAVHIGISLHAARVSDDVRTSRTALVTAREEERLRLRRDLHDGLGPTLASLRLHLAALQQMIETRPDEALDLVGRLRADVRDTSAQVRTLVYDLRPAALDELGLADSLRARAADLAGPGVTVTADDLPDLPAAVEVALYRIACEALMNVARHSGATHVEIVVEPAPGGVVLRVDDDGRGLPEPLVPGVGVRAMRERAEEIGGVCTVGPVAGGGTRVTAELPLRAGNRATAP